MLDPGRLVSNNRTVMNLPLNTPPAGRGVAVRPATPADVSLVVTMIRELADYEKLAHEVESTEGHLVAALFGSNPRVFCDIAEWNGEVGGLSVWFYNFSTFTGRHGLYLEDLYVRSAVRSHGLGRALLKRLAQRCVAENLARMEWSVLDWNTPAIDFYRAQGAELLDDWTTCRLTGDALVRLGTVA